MKKAKGLDELREEIDILDRRIISLLEERFEVIREVSDWKKKMGIEIEDLSREQEILKKIEDFLKESGSEKRIYLERIYKVIFEESKEYQKKLRE